MKRKYTKLSISSFSISADSQILQGSVTSNSISVNTVTVEDYDNGFSSIGGFGEISFD